MFENQYIKQRIQKAQDLLEMGKKPYRNDSSKTISNLIFTQKFENLKSLAEGERKDVSSSYWVSGRVKFLRLMGKAAFIKIEDQSGILQAYLSQNDLAEDFELVKKILEVGDIVNIYGYPFVTKTGELSIHTMEFKILTKSIIPLPEKFHGLTDIELRYRQRYLDLIVNPDVKETFKLRSAIISNVRRFFEDKGFLEVETPMLHPIPGGANAKPFITHHNALDVHRYLRIAPELYLKRLVVGGFEAVFEINRNFRNEGMDHSHNPEFTMIEFYWAYKTYEDLITLSKELFAYLLEKLHLPTKIPHNGNVIDFSNFTIISYKDALEKIGNISRDIIEDEQKLKTFLQKHHIKIDSTMGYGKLLGEAFDEFVEEKLIDPTFITQYPIDISPLARRNDQNPEIADRFELFIGGKEIANGFSELNDPLDQLERFKAQVKAKDAGDEEAQYMDEDYVWALGYGLPPTAGQGIGIDRLVMLLSDSKTIKDVILFPAMKPVKIDYNNSITEERE
ncbi:lysine--tRNA ligase [Helicobacter cappadocius]|uniref:Lysine--tRNA ligase n=1 Tax=Helicobacter cappadocius TaxID=3063998 RepID=A0AA90PQ02_9HELI|nr:MULTISPECIES: lysine--tRNA ligase [unclassified Helicobacter]MDO7252718.1 lysine--tRNA ligase [Helicobacter sp. faydin-H75]MDP2538586.1 lysine--tRNA ligase [Helicobacter sp. faydin-H76]